MNKYIFLSILCLPQIIKTSDDLPATWQQTGQTLAHYYANAGQVDQLQQRVQVTDEAMRQTNEQDRYPGSTPAHIVLCNRHLSHDQQSSLLKLMLEKHPELVHAKKSDGVTLGHLAASRKNIPALCLLRNCGDKFDKKDDRRRSVLDHVANFKDSKDRFRAFCIVYPPLASNFFAAAYALEHGKVIEPAFRSRNAG